MSLLMIVTILHVLGAAVGVGAATVSDWLFLRSMRNRTISSDQFSLLHTCAHVVLAGLAVAVTTGLLLVLNDASRLAHSYFQLKMTAVLVLMLNGLMFHLSTLRFLDKRRDRDLKAELPGWRLWQFAGMGAMSVVSWYTSIILAVGSWFAPGYGLLLALYLAAIGIASLVARGVLHVRLQTATPKHETQLQPPWYRRMKWDAWLIALLLLLFAIGLTAALLQP